MGGSAIRPTAERKREHICRPSLCDSLVVYLTKLIGAHYNLPIKSWLEISRLSAPAHAYNLAYLPEGKRKLTSRGVQVAASSSSSSRGQRDSGSGSVITAVVFKFCPNARFRSLIPGVACNLQSCRLAG